MLQETGKKYISMWSRDRVLSMDVRALCEAKWIVCSPVNYEVASFNDDKFPAILLDYDYKTSSNEMENLPTDPVMWFDSNSQGIYNMAMYY
jgi:hypothetical protein